MPQHPSSNTPLPLPFIELMQKVYPPNVADELTQVMDEEQPVVSIRRNPFKGTALDALPIQLEGSTSIPWCNNGYWLTHRPAFSQDPLWHAGVYYVQEAASMMIQQIAPLLPPHPIRVLDLCAAPGGKSTLLADILPQGSTLICNEPIPKRATILAENICKWGVPALVTSTYPQQLVQAIRGFDLILVDAPCSGEGMFRKSIAARTDWSLEAVDNCVARQLQILEAAWSALAPGGLLLYSTCTFNPYENEEMVEHLLEWGAELKQLPIRSEWNTYTQPSGIGYHCFPHLISGEGLYFACVQKPHSHSIEPLPKEGKKRKQNARVVDKNLPLDAVMLEWVKPEYAAEAVRINESEIAAIPGYMKADYHLLREGGIPLLHAGIALAEQNGKRFTPHRKLPFSIAMRAEQFPQQDLSREDALRYLAGITPEALPTTKQLTLLTYMGVVLGFANAVGSRFNNLYPKSYRLRQYN